MAFSDDEEDQDTDQPQTPSKSYEGEDTSPTTERELKGWYAYPIAAEVFAVVAVGMSLQPLHPNREPHTMLRSSIKAHSYPCCSNNSREKMDTSSPLLHRAYLLRTQRLKTPAEPTMERKTQSSAW
jgi:hypothetical protein